MKRLVAARLGQALLALFGMTLLVWALLPLTPGDPAERTLLGRGNLEPQPEQIQALRREFGLDQPLHVQYGLWLSKVVRGHLGISYRSKQPVERELAQRAQATLLLAAGGVAVAVAIAVPLAVLAARYENRWPDQLSRLFALVGTSLPSFWIGLLLLDLVAVRLRWTDALARADLQHLPLPAFVLGLGLASVLTRVLRAGLVAELGRRYALVMRARGAGPWYVLLRHALPNATLPGLNVLALGVGGLLGGAAAVETVFTWPGMGLYIVDAIGARDLPVIQGFAVISAGIFIVVNLLADLLAAVLDPRLRHQVQY
ncbi:MAG TPA: ABC transporter permease [Chloroflexota bacterium]|nr:ABC transporter permease [Chloroflexota bacterium]